MLKPAALLYPTWIRLRENLYRFDAGRSEAWKGDISSHFPVDVDDPSSHTLRLRLGQLTLELHESAMRYTRLAVERAAVTRKVIKLGVILAGVCALLAAACVAFSSCAISAGYAIPLSLVAAISSGGLGAIFSRLQTLRNERARHNFEEILKSDMVLRTCIGFSAALFLAAVLLSGSVSVFQLPDDRTARMALFVVIGFVAGFSDRLFYATLSQVIGTGPGRSSGIVVRGH